MKKKIKNQSGETLVETLVAMLVIVSAVVMLSGGIVTAARINKSTRDLQTSFEMENKERISGVKISIIHSAAGNPTDEREVDAYRTKDTNQYCFYEELQVNHTP